MTEALVEHAQPKSSFVRPSAKALVRCEGLEKWYGGVHALKGVDFHAEPAEVAGDVELAARAAQAVAEALVLEPGSAEARTGLGLIHLERGENERAIAEAVHFAFEFVQARLAMRARA